MTLVHEEITDFHSLDEEIQMNVVKFKKEKQDKMKGLGKALYILARIGKIMVTICIPIVIATMIIIGCLINLVEVKMARLPSKAVMTSSQLKKKM